MTLLIHIGPLAGWFAHTPRLLDRLSTGWSCLLIVYRIAVVQTMTKVMKIGYFVPTGSLLLCSSMPL